MTKTLKNILQLQICFFALLGPQILVAGKYSPNSTIKFKNNEYKVGKTLGRGEEGEVYLLTPSNGQTDQKLIVKDFSTGFERLEGDPNACLEEVERHDLLRSSGIPTVQAWCEGQDEDLERDPKAGMLIKEFVEGPTLFEALKSGELDKNPTLKEELKSFIKIIANSSHKFEEFHSKNIMYSPKDGKWLIIDSGDIPPKSPHTVETPLSMLEKYQKDFKFGSWLEDSHRLSIDEIFSEVQIELQSTCKDQLADSIPGRKGRRFVETWRSIRSHLNPKKLFKKKGI